MSLTALGAVWSFPVSPQEKLVLLVMADHADDSGGNVFPSVARIMQMSGMSERAVQRTIRLLVSSGVVEVVRPARPGRPTEYRILIDGADGARWTTPRPVVESCPRWLRVLVKQAFRFTCAYCEQPGTETVGPDGALWTIDRLIPGSKGGRYTPENVALACRRCNGSKSTVAAAPEAVQRIGAVMAPYYGAIRASEMAPDPSRSDLDQDQLTGGLKKRSDHGLGANLAPNVAPTRRRHGELERVIRRA